MKYKKLLLIAIAVLSCTESKNIVPCPDSTTISLGKIFDNWVYENEDLNIAFKLPQNWNYLNYRMHYSVNTNSAPPYQDTLNITLKDIKNNDNKIVLFTLFENSFPQEYTAKEKSKRIVFLLELSKNQDAEKDIQEWEKIFKEQTKNIPKEVKEKYLLKRTTLPFGKNEKLPAFDAMGRITGFKNYGCYNLVISIDYFSETDKSEIFDILQKIENKK